MEIPLNQILVGDVIEKLKTLPDGCIQTCVTSPPYFGLRDYQVEGQIGIEATPSEYVEKLVNVFREVRRVLRDDGTVWLNLGDSYVGAMSQHKDGGSQGHNSCIAKKTMSGIPSAGRIERNKNLRSMGLKSKDLIGIPWRVAFALQEDGWYLRSDIVWEKLNPMPESVTDRCSRSHEYIFMLTKKERYFYDHYAIREPHSEVSLARVGRGRSDDHKWADGGPGDQTLAKDISKACHPGGRNKRSVWTVTTQPFAEAHFAVFPENLIVPCVLAGTSERGACKNCGAPWKRIVEDPNFEEQPKRDTPKMDRSDRTSAGQAWQDWRDENPSKTIGWEPTCECGSKEVVPSVILDPFMGSGTTALVALKAGRHFVGTELNPEYAEIARKRIEAELTQKKLF